MGKSRWERGGWALQAGQQHEHSFRAAGYTLTGTEGPGQSRVCSSDINRALPRAGSLLGAEERRADTTVQARQSR